MTLRFARMMALQRPLALLLTLLFAATALAGCHGLDRAEDPVVEDAGTGDDSEGEGAGDPSEEPTSGSDDEEPSGSDPPPPSGDDEISITLAIQNAPASLAPGGSATLTVRATGDDATADTAEVRWGRASTASKSAGQLSTNDFQGALAGPASFEAPGTYSVQSWSPSEPGDYYLRAHVVVDGSHFWSPEKKVAVDAPAVEETTGAADRTISITTGGSAADFSPDPVTIATGETVRWSNDDATSTPHTATSTAGPGSFDTGNIGAGADSKVFRFNDAGTYDYQCEYHPTMVGRITVQ